MFQGPILPLDISIAVGLGARMQPTPPSDFPFKIGHGAL